MVKKYYIIIMCFLLGISCSHEKKVTQNVETQNYLEMLDSGVSADLIYSVSKQTNIGGFMKKLGLMNGDDHWEETMGKINGFEREAGVNSYTILGGGVEFTTTYNAAGKSDAMSYYSKITLTHIVTSFTYSVNGQTFSKILVEGHYVNP